MSGILIKMTPAAMKQFGGKGDNRETEWMVWVTNPDKHQRQIMDALGFGGKTILDMIVIGSFVPGHITGTPYIVPEFFDTLPDHDVIWQRLAEMALTYPVALAQSTALPAVVQTRKAVKVVEDSADE